jgi:hypothetical protein
MLDIDRSRISLHLALEYDEMRDINIHIETMIAMMLRGKPLTMDDQAELQKYINIRDERVEKINGMLNLLHLSN